MKRVRLKNTIIMAEIAPEGEYDSDDVYTFPEGAVYDVIRTFESADYSSGKGVVIFDGTEALSVSIDLVEEASE